MNEYIIVGVCFVLGIVITALGLARTGKPGVTHADRANVCSGLFKHFNGEE